MSARDIYYFPPREPGRVWFSSEWDEDNEIVLIDNGLEIKNPTLPQFDDLIQRQEELYQKLYPHLCN